MIKANELRIGNWFQCDVWDNGDLKYYKVASIRKDGVYAEDESGIFGEVKGIPLTPEILEQAGFQMPSQILELNDSWFLYEENGFWLQVENDAVCERLHINCQYLHQLQNVYFALTGEELKIVL